ncbi:Swarming motility protein ybiA [Achromatium sp. WMS3]|nr:Swarming motility protein ybiA [Achromatium sp. WMS3]
MTIYFYTTKSEYGDFSNFARYGIELDGLWWPTVEHYFQAQKFPDNAEHKESIRTAASPGIAKQLGRKKKISRIQEWEQIKDSIMLTAVRKKFTTHPELRTLLLSTGTEKLVENAPNDYYWGCGQDGSGKNRLGTILMQVRAELKAANS